jgi:hypothetical protein
MITLTLCRSVPHALAWFRRTIVTPSCGRCTQATMTALRLTRERHMASAEDHRGSTTSRSSYSGRGRCTSRSSTTYAPVPRRRRNSKVPEVQFRTLNRQEAVLVWIRDSKLTCSGQNGCGRSAEGRRRAISSRSPWQIVSGMNGGSTLEKSGAVILRTSECRKLTDEQPSTSTTLSKETLPRSPAPADTFFRSEWRLG